MGLSSFPGGAGFRKPVTSSYHFSWPYQLGLTKVFILSYWFPPANSYLPTAWFACQADHVLPSPKVTMSTQTPESPASQSLGLDALPKGKCPEVLSSDRQEVARLSVYVNDSRPGRPGGFSG